MRITIAAMATIAVLLPGCSARSTPETADPAAAAEVIGATAPDRPLRVIFGWRLQDREARFSGRGAARIEPPHRARLDLFGPQGEGYLSAAVVDAEVRLPPGVDERQVPPAAMMWAVLGVVAPPDHAVLEGTRSEGNRLELHYDTGDARLVYVLEAGRIRSVEWMGDRRKMAVELSGRASGGLPERAVYRDWAGQTELVLNLEEVDEVESFPPDIWAPGR